MNVGDLPLRLSQFLRSTFWNIWRKKSDFRRGKQSTRKATATETLWLESMRSITVCAWAQRHDEKIDIAFAKQVSAMFTLASFHMRRTLNRDREVLEWTRRSFHDVPLYILLFGQNLLF